MSLTSKLNLENNVFELEVAVSADQLKEATDKVFRRKVKSISVPGFRKGKAPRQIIEKMYGDGIFLEDAVNDLYPQAYSDAVDEAGIEPVDRAQIEILTVDKADGFTFKATVTAKPEVMVRDYKGIKADKPIKKVTDADVDAEVDRLRDRNARIITVDDRAAVSGDTAVIDFEGFVDGVPFEGGTGEDHQLVLGSGSFIDNFEDQIVGHKTGDEFDVNVTFPEQYHAEELKGKPAVFKVKLKEIKGKELPELDDEFAKDISEFDTLAEFREDLRKKLQEHNDQHAQNDLENALIDEVIKGVEGDIPEVMYTNKIDDMVRDFEYRLQSQGMNMQLYLQYTGMDEESFRKSFRDQAERQVKIRLALEKIAELEQLEISEEELEKEYARVAESYQIEVEKVRGFVPEREVRTDLLNLKAIDFVRDNAKVTEVEAKDEAAGENIEKKPKKKPAAKKTTKKADKAEENTAKEKERN